jgi:hypothetical protein
MTDRPTRRGFLAACSAAAAALGLTAKVGPPRRPVPDSSDVESFDGPAHTHYLGPAAHLTSGERLFAGEACYIGADGLFRRSVGTVRVIDGGSGYTSKPTVTFSGVSVTPSGIQVRTR